MARVAIQVLLYYSSNHLERLLKSVAAQTFQDWELWICENSVDASEQERVRAILATSHLPHQLIISKTNTGFDGGHTRLFQENDAPFVLLLNDDTWLDPKYIEEVVKRMESDKKIASVTGLVYRADGQAIDTTGLEYKCLAQIVDRRTAPVSDGEVFGVSGAIGLYRRSAVEMVGGLFEPSWFMYKEDVDLALRLKKGGFKAWFEPKAIAWHARGLKQATSLVARFFQEWKRPPRLKQCAYVNQWRIYKRHFSWSLGIRDIARSFVVEGLRSGGTLIASPIVFFRSWYDILFS